MQKSVGEGDVRQRPFDDVVALDLRLEPRGFGAALALPAMRTRPRRGFSPSTWSLCVRIFMTDKIGRAGADEQGRDHRVRSDSSGAGSYLGPDGRRIAPLCNGLHDRERGLAPVPGEQCTPVMTVFRQSDTTCTYVPRLRHSRMSREPRSIGSELYGNLPGTVPPDRKAEESGGDSRFLAILRNNLW